MKMSLKNFRCFADSGEIELLPITFLVGENSAGKTTLLAGLRYLLETANRTQFSPFNRDPFFLGGFDQIAHRRKKSQAENFSLSISLPAEERRPSYRETYHFRKGAVQPDLYKYKFEGSGFEINAVFQERLSIQIKDDEGALDFRDLPEDVYPKEALRRDVNILRYVLPTYIAHEKKHSGPVLARVNRISQAFAKSVTRRRVFASAPVRTRPLRTYTPSEIEPSSEGSHVPLDMAREKIVSPTRWASARAALADFGKKSGLFDNIDIRRLGESDSDPFQVLVSGEGNAFNIVDVGYGVSQALPVVYQLQQLSSYDAFLLQQPEVHLHPRAQAEIGSLIVRLANDSSGHLFVIETHSDYIIDRVRMEIAKGRIDSKDVTIAYFDKVEGDIAVQNIYLSEAGDILNPPANFRSFFLEEQARLLDL